MPVLDPQGFASTDARRYQVTGREFEQEIRKLLDKHFPCCALSNIPIYRPDVQEDRLKGYEIDNLLHVSSELADQS